MGIPKQTLQRLPLYLNYCSAVQPCGSDHISATAIAEALGLNPVQVRKDLAMVSSSGRPKVGYICNDLIGELRQALGYNNTTTAIIVGAGKMGRALMGYEGFAEYGLDIVAAFDTNAQPEDAAAQQPIYPMDKMQDLCRRLKVHLGILTVPREAAQAECDRMVDCGILAIWNFAPMHLMVPDDILVYNENMPASLAVLSNHLAERMQGKKQSG